jgi:hypothetical protein
MSMGKGGIWFRIRNWDTTTDPERPLSQFTCYTDGIELQLVPRTPGNREAWKFWKKYEHLWHKHRNMVIALENGDARGQVARDAVWDMIWDFCVAKGAPLFKEFRKAYPDRGEFYDDFIKHSEEQE